MAVVPSFKAIQGLIFNSLAVICNSLAIVVRIVFLIPSERRRKERKLDFLLFYTIFAAALFNSPCIAFISSRYYSNPKSDFVKWKDLLSLITEKTKSAFFIFLLYQNATTNFQRHYVSSRLRESEWERGEIKVWKAINLSPEFPTRLRRRLIFHSRLQCVWQTKYSVAEWDKH